jgi:anti-sigma28 factor (negative regulator of flagellin synthesis)
MRIDPKIHTPVLERAATESTATARPEIKDDQAAVVNLSSAGAAAQASASEHAMSARLEQLRTALERGAYVIDLDKLAARIVDDELARLQGDR